MFERLISYPLERYQTADWVLLSALSPALFALLVGLFILVIGFSLWRVRGALSLFRLSVIALLQILLLLIVLVLLMRPALQTERLVPQTNHLLFLIDSSASMAYRDQGQSRIDTALAAYQSEPMQQLRADYSNASFVFSDQLTEYDPQQPLPPPGQVTRLADNLVIALQQASESSLAAVVLISDGADTSVDHFSASLSADQLAEIASFNVPVHTLGIGRERIEEDIELSEVNLPQQVLPGSQVTAALSIRHDAPGSVRVKLYQGDNFITSKRIELNAEPGLTRAELDFRLEQSGVQELTFQLDPIEGETNLQNNSRRELVEVKRQQYQVLYVEGEPRWEYKYIRRAMLGDEQIALHTLLWVSDQKYYRQGIDSEQQLITGFPSSRDELFNYDAIAIGSIAAPRFTSQQQQLIHDFVSERGGSLLMLGGRHGLSDGGWGNTVVGSLLPSRLNELESGFERARASTALAAEGLQSRFLNIKPEDSFAKAWQGLPELSNYHRIGSLRPAAVRLLDLMPTGSTVAEPLLVSQPYGKGHAMILATGGTWRWQMSLPAEDQRHQTFWRQLLRHLVINTPEPVSLSLQHGGDHLQLSADVRDEAFEAIDGATVSATLSSEQGIEERMELRQVAGSLSRYQLDVPFTGNGTYYVDLWVSKGDEPVSHIRQAFHQEAGEAEAFAIRQNRTQLERIAEVTGGQYWSPDELDNLPEAIARSEAGVKERQVDPLWTIPLVWWLLVLIKLLEWGLRRRWQRI